MPAKVRLTKAALKKPTRRLFLFHWHPAEAAAWAKELRAQGWEVALEAEDGARGGKAVLADLPDAVLVSLRRLPSHGQEAAAGIRGYAKGRAVPILFIDGDSERLRKVKAAVPDGEFLSGAQLAGRLAQLAAAWQPADEKAK